MDQARKTLTLSTQLSPITQQKLMISPKLVPSQQQQLVIQAKQQRKNKIRAALNWLVTQYPESFNIITPRPLKLRIENDIIADIDKMEQPLAQGIPSKKAVREAIVFYTRNIKYIKTHLTCSHRINLQGHEINDQPITSAHKDYATQAISKIKDIIAYKAKVRKKRKLEDD